MLKITKLVTVGLLASSLSACFEVEDNSNDDVVAALEEQNELLQQEQDNTTQPVTIFGKIINASDPSASVDANVTVKVGTEWLEPVNTTGEFSIAELPINSDILIRVESTDNSFMERAFYGRTTEAELGQTVFQSVGDLQVSEGETKSYSVIDAATNEVFEGLVFEYNPSTSFSDGVNTSGRSNYSVTSTFDEQTQLYTLTLPKDVLVTITADRDIDGDGIADFTPLEGSFVYGDHVRLSSWSALQLETMLVDVASEYLPVELRLTIIDPAGDIIPDIEFFASDRFLGALEVSFDSVAQEYVFNYQSSGQVVLNMPAFQTIDEVNYQSGSISIQTVTEDAMSIYASGFTNSYSNEVEVIDGIASLILQARQEVPNSTHINRISSIIDENDNFGLKQLYSAPIGLLDDSVTLNQTNVFKVIKGNESDTDIVPAGTTKIGNTTQPIPLSTSLQHNNTFLVASPTETLSAGTYTYNIGALLNVETNQEFDTGFRSNFEIEAPADSFPAFDINQIRLDNNNGTTNGVTIVTENTAGVASTSTNNSSTVRIYFPTSIQNLDFFELDLESYVRNGANIVSARNIRVIDNDRIWVSQRNLVSLADNENVESFTGGSANADTNTAIEDGVWYLSTGSGVYLSDNTTTSSNTATYRYIYRTVGEDAVVEGRITLPIL